ncbi:MAG: hypothetical protein QNJ09_16090, partial [Paracoccaceae bacterium]|nr:hypothetical protein [Paracoccaceae bacterium]
PLPVLSQADGRLTLFATAQKPNPFLRRPFPEFDEVTLFMRSQDATGAWLPWEEFVERNFVINHDHSFSPPFATGMTGDGRAGIFLGEYAFMDRKVYYALQTAANGAFQRWKSLGHPPAEHVAATTATGAANWYREVVHLRVASNSDGRLELVALVRESLLENVGGVLLQQLPNYHLWHIRQD